MMNRPQTPPVNFLLVDDREENLLALEALLRRDGLRILKARSGDEALELLLTHDVALALLDVQMPDMDGFALAEFMRGVERSRHIPIIFITAAPQEQHREFRGYDAGAVDFLVKPINSQILWHKTETFFQLHRQRQQLAETLRLNEMFVAAVGHELRNPLNAMMMATELIRLTAKEAAVRRPLEILQTSGRRMSRMILDLFDLSRARLGSGIPIERQPVDALPIIRKVIAEFEAASPERSIHLVHDGAVTGSWDAGRLAQILSNLIGNAIRHGAAHAPVTVRVQGAEEHATIEVHNGGTIDAEVLPYLFDPFQSHKDRAARSEGLGLGLYIVHQLLLAHGGAIEVSSTESAGTAFRIQLPREPAPATTSSEPGC
ncbi:MAG TPA: hybrid sensor histidine kinase/response regulator [Pseudomonadota bacterium]|nr:hybrid sensor histidine kinase/response regulator [Pseudomonadota bacterium]